MAYMTAAAIRAAVPALVDATAFPTATLDALVAEFEPIAENYRGQAYVARTATDILRPSETVVWLWLRWPVVQSITSIAISWPAVTGSTTIPAADYTFDADAGAVHYPAGFPAGSIVTVAYTHGATTIPAGLTRATGLYVRSCALADKSVVPRDVIAQTFEGGLTRFSTPDWDAGRPTGWLEVDRLLNALPDRRKIA